MYENLSPEEVERLVERAVYLVSGFIQDSLTHKEHNELDRWVAGRTGGEQPTCQILYRSSTL